MTTGDVAWMLISTALVLFMVPGLALFYGGLVAEKNVHRNQWRNRSSRSGSSPYYGRSSVTHWSLVLTTLLLFPRELAPAYYDRIIAACEQSGFEPRVRAFPDPPPQAMLARLPAGRKVNLAPASYGLHAAAADSGIVARKIGQPEILAEWSILSPTRSQSAAITRFLESARRCADENDWLRLPDRPTSAETEAPARRRSERTLPAVVTRTCFSPIDQSAFGWPQSLHQTSTPASVAQGKGAPPGSQRAAR
jgi:hypothetical protein